MSKLSDDTKKKLIISLGIVLIVLIIVFFFIKRQNNNYNYIKKNKNNYIVYTLKHEKKDIYTRDVPYLNIKGNLAKQINKDIKSFTSECMSKDMCTVSYEYSINGIVLSILVKQVDYDTEFAPTPSAKSYNVNLKELELIDDVKLLELFETDESYIEKIIEEEFKKYYEDILDLEYYNERECDYNCFLEYREVSNYLDNVSYYVSNGKLIAYRPFIFYSVFGEEDYFKEDNFKFIIKES